MTETKRLQALEVVHSSQLQREIMQDENHPLKWALDYVYDLTLQKTLFN